jgi:DNA (cytosine-5)-methyltransferase 1
LFIQAIRKDCGKKIIWPRPSNVKNGDMFLPKWRSANEIIDWSIPCQLIKDRKKPLAKATLKRIEYGIKEFWGESAVPFIAKLYGQSTTESLENPLSTISCSGAHHMLIRPYKTEAGKNLEPFITEYYGNGRAHQIPVPLPTITTKDRFTVCGVTDGIELGYRMLQPNELAAATGFPKDYKFTGCKTEVVKQIGNAVPPNFAKAMFGQILKEMTA